MINNVAPAPIEEFLQPAVRALPRKMAARIGPFRITLVARLERAAVTSRWTIDCEQSEIVLATDEVEPHDLAMELLVCAGQLLWEKARPREREAFLGLLAAELDAGVEGEIDEEVLEWKRRLLRLDGSARRSRCLERYTAAAFAHTAAEYVHCLWHDVTAHAGPEHLPAPWLRRRLELFARWFPPDRGYRLFPSGRAAPRRSA